MGCGVSQPQVIVNTAPAPVAPAQPVLVQPVSKEDEERNTRRAAVMERYKLSERDKGRILSFPIFKIPTEHHQTKKHKIDFVFFGVKDESCTDVSIFFAEESEEVAERTPIHLTLVKDQSRANYTNAIFHHCFAPSSCTWDGPATPPEARTHTEQFTTFESETQKRPDGTGSASSRIVLYVNTSTHHIGSRASPNTTYSTISEYSMYSGNPRQAVEVVLRGAEAAFPEKKEVSPLAQLIPVRSSHSAKKKAEQQSGEKGEKQATKAAA